MYCSCGECVPEARAAIGYVTCLSCGAEQAKEEARKNKAGVVQAYPKGPLQFLPTVATNSTRDARRELSVSDTYTAYRKATTARKPKRKPIGVMWLTAEDRSSNQGVAFYSDSDVRLKHAHRVVFYGERP